MYAARIGALAAPSVVEGPALRQLRETVVCVPAVTTYDPMMQGERCFIVRRADEQRVEVELRESSREDSLRWARQWPSCWPRDMAFEDAHWDWEELIELSLAMPEQFACYSLLADGKLQGLRLLEVSEDEVDLYGTHALRVSTAPWNRPPRRVYRGVGSLLVAAGLLRSIADGRDGEMHCSSLPEAEPFHSRNGMERFDGLDEEGLARYRFHGDAARAFLARVRNDGYLVHTWT